MPQTTKDPKEPVGAREPGAFDFAPGLLAIQERPPGPLPRLVLYLIIGLCGALLVWAVFGELNIIAVAGGRLVPKSYIQIVQPAQAGVVKAILVTEGEKVAAGQVLMRMDAQDAKVDRTLLEREVAVAFLQRRRIRAELAGRSLRRKPSDPRSLFAQAQAQYAADRLSYHDRLNEAGQAYLKAERNARAAQQILIKLKEITPIARREARDFASLGRGGYVPRIKVLDKERIYLTDAQNLQAQHQTVAGLQAAVAQAAANMAEIRAHYRAHLRTEGIAADERWRRLKAKLAKLRHKMGRLALRAPEAGTVMTLATHSLGTVVTPGTVLVTIVPDHVPLLAQVRVKNRDMGFVYVGQHVRVKVSAYPFEKYGTVDGVITYLGADASRRRHRGAPRHAAPTFKALVALRHQVLRAQGKIYKLVPGMQVIADLHEGHRTVMNYLLSPVVTTLRNSGR
jgi:HlyD family secretion protein